MIRTLYVALGGGVGSVARYWLAGAVQGLNDGEFPFGTFTVNIVGSFIVGLVMELSVERAVINPDLRILLAVGFCGGFTTMSTFSYETLALLRDGSVAAGLLNIGGSIAACLAAVWLGSIAGRII